jgi:hypothetical protein
MRRRHGGRRARVRGLAKVPPTSHCSPPQSTWSASACSGLPTRTAPGRLSAADKPGTAGRRASPARSQPSGGQPRPAPDQPERPRAATGSAAGDIRRRRNARGQHRRPPINTSYLAEVTGQPPPVPPACASPTAPTATRSTTSPGMQNSPPECTLSAPMTTPEPRT